MKIKEGENRFSTQTDMLNNKVHRTDKLKLNTQSLYIYVKSFCIDFKYINL